MFGVKVTHSNANWASDYTKSIKDGAAQAVEKGIVYGTAQAKRYAPVKTGALKRSIQFELIEPGTGKYGSPLDYALWIETGTTKQKAQPYMRPSAEDVRKSMPRLMAREING